MYHGLSPLRGTRVAWAGDMTQLPTSVAGAPQGSAAFTTTHWSVVLAAGADASPRAEVALEHLCRVYWFPLYAYVRRQGHDSHEAQDLTQEFFLKLLDKQQLRRADAARGKFRTFLLTALANFLRNEWHKRQTLKRGGRRQFLPLDETSAEQRYFSEPVESLTPESLFERQWVRALIEQVLARLKQEYVTDDKARLFARLEPALSGEVAAGAFAEWAAELGQSPGAVRVALHRMRRRFGELLRSEIAHTVASPEEIDDEIRQLFAAVSGA
jgi:RNA polymerase sigma factor (sigma-70 family)